MTYVSKPMGNRLGIYADKIEAKRRVLGLDERGFPVRPENRDLIEAVSPEPVLEIEAEDCDLLSNDIPNLTALFEAKLFSDSLS